MHLYLIGIYTCYTFVLYFQKEYCELGSICTNVEICPEENGIIGLLISLICSCSL